MPGWHFPTADELRDDAAPASVIVDEIRAIDLALLAAADAGSMETTVNGTTMTGDPAWADVWAGRTEDPVKAYAMDSVIDHYRARGYVIVREVDPDDPALFRWRVSW